MSYYAHRQFLVSVEKAEDDGWLETVEGIQPITKGKSYIATNELGHKFVIDERFFLDSYVEVKKIEQTTKTQTKSPFEQQMEEAYKQSWVGFEDTQYINGTYDLSKSKN